MLFRLYALTHFYVSARKSSRDKQMEKSRLAPARALGVYDSGWPKGVADARVIF